MRTIFAEDRPGIVRYRPQGSSVEGTGIGRIWRIERWARWIAVIAALLVFEDEGAPTLVGQMLVVAAVGYLTARHSGRVRIKVAAHNGRDVPARRLQVREHLRWWVGVAVIVAILAIITRPEVALLFFALWSAGFIAGDFVHSRTHLGHREMRQYRAAFDNLDNLEFEQALQREREFANEFRGNYDEYLFERGSTLLTPQEFEAVRFRHLTRFDDSDEKP